ncbi:SatD family protein [Buchananella hordeovulneris]|uniref:SatD family protein n=1 Tax=Buchananella hordeovulneris TaxID=52770 RepID=A0A1Q5PYC3_9ACTO|nr:SatD family protein [Buchananella hordeovulneris]MDO5079706.1 SatD family protein [Buchananella hordeovulneris]OKL52390.1 hypothetical protein BSZ40_02615 [Buchananella hordeovulneris]RRD53818.1 hypothetical protein EII12_00240 [Buchananella hordeovulneris]
MVMQYAVIADIVRSRELADRAVAQRQFLATLTEAGTAQRLTTLPYATVGDEFQAVAPSLAAALNFTLHTHLVLPETLGLRFGIGAGEITEVDGAIQAGSAWIAARQAIDTAHARQDQGLAYARTAYQGSAQATNAIVDALLLLRDQTIFQLRPRKRRVCAALLTGTIQTEIARTEKISQQAVSELARSPEISALLAVQQLLQESPAAPIEEHP